MTHSLSREMFYPWDSTCQTVWNCHPNPLTSWIEFLNCGLNKQFNKCNIACILWWESIIHKNFKRQTCQWNIILVPMTGCNNITSARNISMANPLKQLMTACWISRPRLSTALIVESNRPGLLPQNMWMFTALPSRSLTSTYIIINIRTMQWNFGYIVAL